MGYDAAWSPSFTSTIHVEAIRSSETSVTIYDDINQNIISSSSSRVLRRIFGPKRDGVTGEWRKLHNEQRNDLYSSPNIVRVIKSRRM